MIRISSDSNYTGQYRPAVLAFHGAEEVRIAGHELIDIHRAYLDRLDSILHPGDHEPPQWNRASYDGGLGKRSTRRAKELLFQCHLATYCGNAELQPVLDEYERALDSKLKKCTSFWKPCNQSTEIRNLLQEHDFRRKVDALGLRRNVAERIKDCIDTLRLDLYACSLGQLDPEHLDRLFELVHHRVPNLRVLILNGNLLTYVPHAVCKLTRLIVLNLGRNRLTSVPDSLGDLTELQNLNLGDNQLVSLPDIFAGLTEVHQLNLGDNPLSHLPETLGDMRSLHLLNIQNILVEELPARLNARIEANDLQIDEDFFPEDWRIQQSHARRFPNPNILHPLSHAPNSLRQSILDLGFKGDKASVWARFETERWARSFSAWLTALTGSEDGKNQKAVLQKNVGKLLDAMEKDSVLRTRCFVKAEEFTSTCHDNVAWGLFEFALDVEERQIELANPTDKELIQRGRGMYAASLVKAAAQSRSDEIRKNFPSFQEDLEIALFYVLEVKHLLPVAVPIEEMKYPQSVPGSITDKDITALQEEIEKAMNDTQAPPGFLNFMSAWLPLQQKLERRKARARAAIDEVAQDKVALLDDDSQTEESKKMDAYEKVSRERQDALKDLDIVETRQYFAELGIPSA